MTKNRRKLTCSKFFEKFKNCFFFEFFAEDVLKSLLRGPKTIRKKYQVVFEKFANLCSKNRKKTNPRFWRKFLKNLIFFKFFEFFAKNILKHILKVYEPVWKKYRVVFEIWAKKKKLPDHPSIPSHPSIQAGGDAWYPVAGGKVWHISKPKFL